MLLLVVKVLLEAAAVSLAVALIGRKKILAKELLGISLVTATILLILELFAPTVGFAAQRGMGMGIGLRTVGFPERFSDKQDALEYFSSMVENFDENASVARVPGALHAGDIVNIVLADPAQAGTYLQRNVSSSELIFGKPIDNINTNLSKLRIEIVDQNHSSQQPLKYGQTVYLKHNAYMNNVNTALFIKISDTLLSHQTGPLFNQFTLVNSTNPASTDYVKIGDTIAISNVKSGNIASGFLKLTPDNKINNAGGSATDATLVQIQPIRDFELNGRHLCICTGETLYP